MSHASGEVWRNGERIGFVEYDGCADFMLPRVYDTFEELEANWRKQTSPPLGCTHTPADVKLYSSYGGGFYWDSKVCLVCKAIVGPTHPYNEYLDEDGHWVEASRSDGHPYPELVEHKD